MAKTSVLNPPIFEETPTDQADMQSHRRLGVHRSESDAWFPYTFRVWAPRADAVQLVGNFVGWEKGKPMTALEGGVWEYRLTSQSALDGQAYKYKIHYRNKIAYRSDPYATRIEAGGKWASILHTASSFRWQDQNYLKKRKELFAREPFYAAPLHIYELDPASWRTHDSLPVTAYGAQLSYRELADALIPYAKGLGYTHVLLRTPLNKALRAEAFFAPSPFFGDPEGFKYFVNKLHANGLGVLLCWSPVRQLDGEHGLSAFDGEALYERAEDPHAFDLSQKEVRDFLLSSANFILSDYHIDGLFVSDVTLFFESAASSESAAAFLSLFTESVKKTAPDALLIADSAAPCGKTAVPTEKGGLGFHFVADDRLQGKLDNYLACDPFFRRYHHSALALPSHEDRQENTLFPQSHGENRSLMAGFFGSYEQKFATNRLYAVYRALFPSKLMTYMGNEYAPFAPQNTEKELEWFMTDFEMHQKFRLFQKELNAFYLANAPLWELDALPEGTKMLHSSENDNVIALARYDRKGNTLIGIFNFSAIPYTDYPLSVPMGTYREVFCSDSESYWGSRCLRQTEQNAAQGNITLDLAPLSAVIIQPATDVTDCYIKAK